MNKDFKNLTDAAMALAGKIGAGRVFVFLNSADDLALVHGTGVCDDSLVYVLPKNLGEEPSCDAKILRSWSGNQSRFSRIKYAFLHAVLCGMIDTDSRIVCVLGPWGKSHLDTITVHDLGLSWSEEFPFDPRSLAGGTSFETVMAVLDIALDIGALGREGKSVGTSFVIGDTDAVMKLSHQAVFNPFQGYPEEERAINRPEVVESIKELAQLDGAFVVSGKGVVLAAGRHLDARSDLSEQNKGFGSRHRAASGITAMSGSVSVVVSESSGRVTIFEKGRVVASLEPVISRRLE
ncbi:MAG: diadenylate cyclase [Spirochaetes bacterium]|jgi:hypothetical protein|nr:diadenylate cyclase [Spirochaetota bacterium]